MKTSLIIWGFYVVGFLFSSAIQHFNLQLLPVVFIGAGIGYVIGYIGTELQGGW